MVPSEWCELTHGSQGTFISYMSSLVVHWLGLCTPTAKGLGSVPGWRSCKLWQKQKTNKQKNTVIKWHVVVFKDEAWGKPGWDLHSLEWGPLMWCAYTSVFWSVCLHVLNSWCSMSGGGSYCFWDAMWLLIWVPRHPLLSSSSQYHDIPSELQMFPNPRPRVCPWVSLSSP